MDQKLGCFMFWSELCFAAEVEVSLAVMAIAGLISCRRFVFSFTALFFVLHAATCIATLSSDLFTVREYFRSLF